MNGKDNSRKWDEIVKIHTALMHNNAEICERDLLISCTKN